MKQNSTNPHLLDMNPRELLTKIKAAFVGEPIVAPVAPIVAPIALATPTVFKTKDGVEVTIVIDDPLVSMTPDVGDAVTIAGAPAPEGVIELEDGSKITVDAMGMIAAYEPVAPVTQPDDQMNQQSQLKFESIASETELAKLYTSFATGTPEERIANLETMCRAMMDYCYGWQIREAQNKAATEAAINVYKQDVSTAQTAVATASTQLQKHEQTLTGMFELVEKILESPTADPITIPESRKETFAAKQEEKLLKLSKSLAQNRKETRPYVTN